MSMPQISRPIIFEIRSHMKMFAGCTSSVTSADVPPVEGVNPKDRDQVETRKPTLDEPFCALVFKIDARKTGDLHYVRVYSGQLKANSRVLNPGKVL